MTTYTALITQYTDLTSNPNAANVARGKYLMNYWQKQYVRKYFSDIKSLFFTTQANVANYPFPVDYKQFREAYIQVGAQKWVLDEIKTRKQFDDLTFIQYTSTIPQYIYLDESTRTFSIFPVPSGSGNQIFFNYKYRLLDLGIEDLTTGQVTVTNGSATFTTSSTVLSQKYVGCYLTIDLNDGGDGQWYLISSVTNSTTATLFNAYGGQTGTYNYTIGQVPVLDSDFHNLLPFRSAMTYYSTIQKDKDKFAQIKSMFMEDFAMLDEFAGNKSTGVDLATEYPIFNPNNFLMY